MDTTPENDREEEARKLLPAYLKHMVHHYHDDFYVSRSFDPRLIVQLMSEGFLPIATKGYLLPKLHVERCVLRLHPHSKLHISKSTRKKSKRFSLSINECFDRVVAGCHNQHGINWLFPPIVKAFLAIHLQTMAGSSSVHGDKNNDKSNNNNNNNNNNNTSSNGGSSHRGQGADAILIDETTHQPCGTTAVRVYSVEVWNEETGELAGGELGYSVGGMYTSLTGFSAQDAAGSVQLLALGKLLMKCGFEYWDLGMEMDYKLKIGAELMPRMSFVREVHRSRVQCRDAVLCCEGERMNAKELIDWEPMKSKGISESCSRASSTVAESTCESQEEQEEVVNVDVTDNIGATATVTSSQKTSKKRPHAAN
mmetsp:Transcript_26385/g.54338  ORF Transcript_26385/g.54338 Transcript_26385/m.54338 type:complete len:367 (-) Transcript_26385:41-1141(-)